MSLLFVSCSANAQEVSYDIDSMAKVFINREKVDLVTFDRLFIEMNQLYPEELAHLGEVLLYKSIRQNNQDGIHRAHDALGVYFKSKGYFSQAFKMLFKAKQYYERTNNATYKMRNYYHIGAVYLDIGNLDECIYWMEKSVELAENYPDRNTLYYIRNNLALVYFQKGNYQSFETLLDKNKLEWKYLNNEHKITYYSLLGNYKVLLKDKPKAKENHEKAMALALQVNQPFFVSQTYTDLAILEFDIDILKSKQYFDSSLYFSKLANYPNKIYKDYFNLAAWHSYEENLDSAMYYFEKSYITASEVNAYANMLEALDEMIYLERENQNWPKVDELHQKIREVKSSQYKSLMRSFDELALFDSVENSNTNIDQSSIDFVLGMDKMTFWVFSILIAIILFLSLALFIVWRHRNPTISSV